MDLNLEQNEAANHDKGPLLIIAGAGTGKTRVITERISHLIKTSKAKPDEILALTFTEKAVNEMIERVDESMPISYEEVCIKTFHAFSEKILRESGLEIGIDPGFKLLSQVEQWFFFKKNLYNFDLDYYRPLGNPNSFIYELLSHFGRLKDELITPADYISSAEKLSDEEKTKVLEIANTYKKYQDLLMKHNYLDFADLTYYVVSLFEKRPSVLKEYQNKYKYILIDEFQDTNYAQFKLTLELAKGHRNIVVVGDDDQSIYKWRGASLSNILKFENEFPEHKKILLTNNYRSSKNILNTSYDLIQNNNPDRLEAKSQLNKKLLSNNDFNDNVEVHHFPTFIDESIFVSEEILRLNREERVDFSDIALLIRSNNLANPFIDELKYLNIPYQIKNPKGLFSLEEIKDLISIVKFLSNLSDNIALLRILKMDVFETPMYEILNLLKDANRNTLFEILKGKTSDNLTISDAEEPIQKIYDLLVHLIDFSKKNSVGLVINEFLNKSKYLNFLIEHGKYEEFDNINQFAKQVAKFERENQERSVVDFSMYLNLLEEANANFPYEVIPDTNGVNVLTAHGAKGLEFKYVFIINCVNQRFPSSKKKEPFFIPEGLTKEIYPEGDYRLQEERRLFYVAMTRAQKKLFITYSDLYEGNKKWKVSPFVKEIFDSEGCVSINHETNQNAIQKLKSFKEPNKSIFTLPPFKSKRLSYTQIDTFKMCPLKYSYRYLLKVPVPQSHTTSFGVSVHDTLKDFYRLLKKGVKVDFNTMMNLYDKNWLSYGYESMEHENIRKKKGEEILKNFFEKNSNPWVVPYYLEKQFNLKIGEYLISGRIDRIDQLSDGTFEVIDYKTGRIKSDLNPKKDLQLSIYALACRDIFKVPVSKLSLYFLEENEKISTQRSDEDLNELINNIALSIEEIKESTFAPTPGWHCQFCDFRLICPAV